MFDDARYQRHLLTIRRGVERETLRVGSDGRPSTAPHPEGLGAPLTHATVTTDFSEALLELITSPVTSVRALVRELNDTHCCVAQALSSDECLWAGSMPCFLDGEHSVPIAEYGTSNSALMKTVYRRGLAQRYGRYMQAIAGVHYNFSMPHMFWADYARSEGVSADDALATKAYLELIRNCRTDAWLLVYLLGATPVVPGYFAHQQKHYTLDATPYGDYGMPYATALRLSKMGYQSVKQQDFRVCANSLEEYIAGLCAAILEADPDYEAIGLKRDGQYIQLGAGLLQIENEHYGVIRPKQSVRGGVPPLRALQQHGIEYVELRCLDVNVEHPHGIDATTMYFLDTFLLRCMLRSSPPLSADDDRDALERLTLVIERGRDPELVLGDGDTQRSVMDWGAMLLEECSAVAEVLDHPQDGTPHLDACRVQIDKLRNPENTPSARLLAHMQDDKVSHFDHVLKHSRHHTQAFRDAELPQKVRDAFTAECASSIQRRHQLELKQGAQDFAQHRDAYYHHYQRACAEAQPLLMSGTST